MLSLPNASFVSCSTKITNMLKLPCVFLAVCSFLKGPKITERHPRTIAGEPALQLQQQGKGFSRKREGGRVRGWQWGQALPLAPKIPRKLLLGLQGPCWMTRALAHVLQDQVPLNTHMVSLFSENEKLRFLLSSVEDLYQGPKDRMISQVRA
jgi:hypothetical protein